MALTITEACKKLPSFAKGLGQYAHSAGVLCDAVRQELEMAKTGENPLTEAQIRALERFLERVGS